MKKRDEILILLLILCLGSFLRFYNLGGPSCFNDELETLRIASYPSVNEMMNEVINTDVHPPAYQLLMYFVVHHIGKSEFWIRFPSVIFGILAILMIYILGKYIYSAKEGLISAAICSVLWAPLYFSQEARVYSMLFFFSMITTFYWLKILNSFGENSKPKTYWIVLYILSAICIVYMQYLGLLLIILQGISSLIVLIKSRKSFLNMLMIFVIIAISYLPWLPYAIKQISIGVEWIDRANILAFGYFLAFLFNQSIWILTLIVLLLILCILNMMKFGFYKNKFFISQDLFLILWLLLPITIIFIKSVISQPVLTYYSLLISAPAAYILVARLLSIIKFKYQSFIPVVFIIILLIDLFYEVNYYEKPYRNQVEVFGKSFKIRSKQMFREAAQYTQSFDSKYPNSVIVSYAWFPDYFDYYFDRINFERKVDINIQGVKDTLKLKNITQDYPDAEYLWILRGHISYDSSFDKWIKHQFKLIHYEPMLGADVWLYKIK
jgi:uncharacterized membrane protein